MAIKSLDELKKIREQQQNKVNLRESGTLGDDTAEIMVGLATCGIAAGARETLNAMMDEVQKQGLKNVRLVRVGCMGYCHSEPVIQVNVPGMEPVLYGNVDEEKGREVIRKHVMGKQLLEDSMLIKSFSKA